MSAYEDRQRAKNRATVDAGGMIFLSYGFGPVPGAKRNRLRFVRVLRPNTPAQELATTNQVPLKNRIRIAWALVKAVLWGVP
ncbi:MAG: hypothetical protein P1V51_19725 [Deltaproteobacteria bacterium]|nr:hypothetical protein [Deltaproteobacteria bacterium]